MWQQAKELQGQFIGKLSEIQRLRRKFLKKVTVSLKFLFLCFYFCAEFIQQQRQVTNGVKVDPQQVEKCQHFMEETSKQAGHIYQNLVETRKVRNPF